MKYPILALSLSVSLSQAAVIAAASITNGSSSYTTPDSMVTLTPYSTVTGAGTIGTFGVSVPADPSLAFFGPGTDNKVADTDGDSTTTNDREAVDITLDATVGLSGITLRWTRAAGAAPDGVVISGFTADPGATTSTGVGLTYNSGSLFLNYSWDAGTVRAFNFSNLNASNGQTLRFSVTDADNPGPQATINSISYDTIPEPSSALLTALAGLALLRRRR
jgi:hypothetical protein